MPHSEQQWEEQAAGEVLATLRQALAAAGVPDDALGLLDGAESPEGPESPEAIVQGLADAGLLPSVEESLHGLLAMWEPLLEADVEPLEAEVSGAEFVSMMREVAGEDGLTGALGSLVAQVEEHGGPAALALLRALASTAPEGVRAPAAEAGDRLAAAGTAEPVWAAQLGSPAVSTCFGYGDGVAQQVVVVTFRYGRRRHAVSVLIDHDLGGGVKDLWVSDRPNKLRSGFGEQAKWIGAVLEDYEPAEACAMLHKALQAPPCPQTPDQVQDVDTFLDLLRSRVRLLEQVAARLGGRRSATAGGAAAQAAGAHTRVTVHRIKVSLAGARPPIWRRLEVPSTITLAALHRVLQDAFGWEDAHLWVFETRHGSYGLPDPELGHRSAASVRLEQVAARAGDRLSYLYDFGDHWQHDLLVEQVSNAETGVVYPRCVAGRRAGPPEDCGGVPGYAGLLEVLADPRHPEHQSMLDWLDLDSADEFDPSECDLDEINDLLPARVLIRA